MASNNFKLGIDASNISVGGGLTHLVELLNAATPYKYGFKKVIVWASQSILAQINDQPWLKKCSHKSLEKNLFHRALWQRNTLGLEVQKENCDLLFVPGGSFVTDFRPIVTMSQNLLPFEWRELRRYGFSLLTLKWLLLRYSQSKSFKKADGIIFLTKYAQDIVLKLTGPLPGRKSIIPHGLDSRFFIPPRTHFPVSEHNVDKPINVIYVSQVEPYKHQWHVVDAISILRKEGIPLVLNLIGSGTTGNNSARIHLQRKINEIDPLGDFIRCYGEIPHATLHLQYGRADIALFASSCETFGQILIEGMAAGLPTACSMMSAMPEILGDAGTYFNPLDPNSIAKKLRVLIQSPDLRLKNGKAALKKAKNYTWIRCANDSFNFFNTCLELD